MEEYLEHIYRSRKNENIEILKNIKNNEELVESSVIREFDS